MTAYEQNLGENNLEDTVVNELQGQGRAMANEAIQSVSNYVQTKFINNIQDETLKNAASGTLKKLSNVDGLVGAFNSIQGNSGLLHETLGDMGRDLEKFIGGQMDRADLMESLAQRAERYIVDTVEKMATSVAAEFGVLAPAIGKMAGYIAGNLFREAVAPFIKAAVRAKVARQKYEQLHGLYEEAIAQAQTQRQQFVERINSIFKHQEKLTTEALNKLDTALMLKDHQEFTKALNDITVGMGNQELAIKSFDDFRTRIRNKKRLVM